VTFAHTPRYAEDYLTQLKDLGYEFDRAPGGFGAFSGPAPARWQWQKPPYPKAVRKVGAAITIFGASAAGLLTVMVILSWFGWITI
jgi:phycobilisome rod-core linker protein